MCRIRRCRGMGGAGGVVRPVTWWLDKLLSGHLGMDEVPASVRSWSRFFIFQGAREIVLMENKEERVVALGKIPKKIRPFVEAEVKRIWHMRREL